MPIIHKGDNCERLPATPQNLIPALRQYQHNDCSGLLSAFDYDETVSLVIGLELRIAKLHKQLNIQPWPLGLFPDES